MAWSISDLFPPWGDTGEKPGDNFQYDGGDQVNEKHFDYLWYAVGELEKQVRSALTDIDSDGDGIVDEADTTNLYKNNDIDSDGDGIVDNSNLLEGNTTANVRNHAPNAHGASHKDGGSDELDAAELAGASGTAGQVLKTDGAAANWESATAQEDARAVSYVLGL